MDTNEFDGISASVKELEQHYVGLLNQGNTCYLNSCLQTLYMTPEIRNAIYQWKKEVENKFHEPSDILLQLEHLFRNLETSNESAIETVSLTDAFGWNRSTDVQQQSDIVEFFENLLTILETLLDNTSQCDLINTLYTGHIVYRTKCLTCNVYRDYCESTFRTLSLPVTKNESNLSYGTVEKALESLFLPEILEGDNKYICNTCQRKTASEKITKVKKFPHILTLQLNRFAFNVSLQETVKLNNRVTFPDFLDLNAIIDFSNCEDSYTNAYELFSIMIHRGTPQSGHYYVYIKDLNTAKWLSFNDNFITPITEKEIKETYGNLHEQESSENAYVLMYRKTQTKVAVSPDKKELFQNQQVFLQIEDNTSKCEEPSDVVGIGNFVPYNGENEESFLQIRSPQEAFNNILFTQDIVNEYELQSNAKLCSFVQYEGEEGLSTLQIHNAEEAFHNYQFPLDIEQKELSDIECEEKWMVMKMRPIDKVIEWLIKHNFREQVTYSVLNQSTITDPKAFYVNSFPTVNDFDEEIKKRFIFDRNEKLKILDKELCTNTTFHFPNMDYVKHTTTTLIIDKSESDTNVANNKKEISLDENESVYMQTDYTFIENNDSLQSIMLEPLSNDCTIADSLQETTIVPPQNNYDSLHTISQECIPQLTFDNHCKNNPEKTLKDKQEKQIQSMKSNSSCSSRRSGKSERVVQRKKSNSSCSSRRSRKSEREPRYIKGMLAMCPFCRMSGSDFNYCMRCKSKLPENVETLRINSYEMYADASSESIESSNTATSTVAKKIKIDTKDIACKISNQTVVIYPPPPTSGGLEIKYEHLKCLEPEQYLNDIIIDFYLLYLKSEVLSPMDKNRTYLFSSFFFKRLISVEATEENIAKQRHRLVERWTKNCNLFEKDFILIPINVKSHWILAIVCFINILCKEPKNVTVTHLGEMKRPWILIFDSLEGTVKINKIADIIRDYLNCEYDKKSTKTNVFTKHNLEVLCPKVPQQLNGYDCGIYLLEFAERFFTSPIQDYTRLTMHDFKGWFEEKTIKNKRSFIKNLIMKIAN